MSELRIASGVASPTPSAQRRSGGPIFIGGLDRSGKTTMRAFLASHPNIAIPAVGSNMETYFYRRYGDLSKPANLDRCLDAMLRYKHVRFLQPDEERIRSEFANGPPTYAHLFSLFLIHHAEREGKPRWGAQSGLIERYADELFEAYPGVKVIHMVRDPRDRYEASLALWPDGRGRAGGATARWRYSTSLAERNIGRYPSGYLIVRFEDLVTEPEHTLRDVCAFLDERFVPAMLAMPGAPKHRDLLAAGSAAGSAATPVSGAFVGGFHGKVPAEELAFIQLHAGRRMRAFGYTPEPSGMTAADRVRFAILGWPSQFARMAGWRTAEAFHQRLPRLVPRRPASKMVLGPDRQGST
jgi:sulfotransferase family protein